MLNLGIISSLPVVTKLHYPPRNIPLAPIRQEAGRVPEIIWMGKWGMESQLFSHN